MLNRLASLLQIRPDETRLAALVAGLFALVEIGRGLGGNSADALFFLRFGVENLPYMFIALGVTNFFVSLSYAAFLGKYDKGGFFALLLLTLAVVLLLERAALILDLRALYPILWLTINMISLLLGMLVWNVAGEVCDTRQAKRLFPFFVSAGILGALIGNLLTGPAAAFLGTENLLIVYAVLLFVCLVLIRQIARLFFPKVLKGSTEANFVENIRVGFDFVRRSPLLQLLALSSVLFSVLFFSITFPFGKAVAAAYHTEAEVAGFLGFFNSAANIVTILCSLFIANRLYARIGIVNSLLLLPITYLLGFIALSINFTLVTAAIARMAQWVMLSGIADSAYSTFFNVVPPDKRAQVRAFDAGVPAQVGIMLSGVLLLLGERVLTTSQIFFMGMIVALICTFIIWRTRREYAQALIAALRAGRFDVFTAGVQAFAGFQNDASAIQVAVQALNDPRPSVRRLGAAILAEMRAASAVPALVEKLKDSDAEVRIAALQALGEVGTSTVALHVISLVTDSDVSVRISALKVLPKLLPHLTPDLRTALEKYLDDGDVNVQAQVAAALLKLGEAERVAPLVHRLLRDTNPKMRVLGLETLGTALTQAKPSPFSINTLVEMLNDESPLVRRVTCVLLGQLHHVSTLGALSARLGDADAVVRRVAAHALRQFGHQAADHILPFLDSENGDGKDAALDALLSDNPALFEPLSEAIHREIIQVREWQDLLAMLPDTTRTTQLLHQELDQQISTSEQRLVKMLGLIGASDAMSLVAQGLRARDPEMHAAAVEALEILGDKQLAKKIIPLLEHTPAQDLAPETALKRLLNGQNEWTRVLAAQSALELRLHDLIPELRLLKNHANPLTRETALHALIYLDRETMETLQTVPLLERVLKLRAVPLFAELSPDDLKQIAEIAREEWYHDGEIIYREGEEGNEMLIIVAGETSIIKGAAGAEKLLAIRKEGDIIGEMAVIDSAQRYATVRAKGEVRALVISGEMFKTILRDRPEVSLSALRTLSRRLRERE